jgi:PhnB protein
MADVKAIPDNYPRVCPYLAVQGAADAIEFYCNALGATRRDDAMTMPDGTIAHAEIAFGDAVVMLSDESPEHGHRSPKTIGGTPVSISLYVENVDAVHAAAIAAGATERRAPADQFYGDRSSTIEDPWGHVWHLMAHVEDVSPEEMQERMASMSGSPG